MPDVMDETTQIQGEAQRTDTPPPDREPAKPASRSKARFIILAVLIVLVAAGVAFVTQ